MIRKGKIARLPRSIREELNERLANGELGSRLVVAEWMAGSSQRPREASRLIKHGQTQKVFFTFKKEEKDGEPQMSQNKQ